MSESGSLKLYAVVNTEGIVENHIESSTDIIFLPCHSTCKAVLNTVNADIGWVYNDGVFTDPLDRLAKLNTPSNITTPPTQGSAAP